MIFISKEGFSNKALDFIKRMAAFKNPEFYKAQAMRLSTSDKARIISLSDETVEYLCIPRGCEDDLCSFLTVFSNDILLAKNEVVIVSKLSSIPERHCL